MIDKRYTQWPTATLSDLLEPVSDPVDVALDQEYREIGVRSHCRGIFHKEPTTGSELGNKKVFWVHPNCLVFNIVFAWEQALARTTENENGFIASHRFPMYRPDPESLDLDYLFYYLNTQRAKHILGLASPGGAGRNRTLNRKRLLESQIPLPPLEVQRELADVLRKWDRSAELHDALVAAKESVYRELSHDLMTGKHRKNGYTDSWQQCPIGSFLKESRVSGTTGADANKLTVKLHGKGVIPKREVRQGSAATQYYRRAKGQFIYSKLDFLNGAFGIIPDDLDGYETTLDLPAFDVSESVDRRWLLFLVRRKEFFEKGIVLANGGRKARRVNPKDFLAIEVSLPSLSEQSAIADVIECGDSELELLREKKAAILEQREGLLNGLFERDICVRSDTAVAKG